MSGKIIAILAHVISFVLGAFVFVLDVVEGVCCELMRAMDYWLSEACKPGKSPRE